MRGRFNGRVVGQDYTGRNTRHNGRAGMYNAVQSALAPSLDITLANGLGPLFTYTRATTATVKDFEGLIKGCLSGELRVQGARRVHNLITTPDLSNAAWSKEQGGTGSAPTLTYGQTDPNGGTTATRAQLNRGAGNTASDYSGVYFRAIASGATTTAVGRVAIKSNTGSSQTFTLKLDATSQVQLTATTSWQTFSVSRTQSSNQDFEILSWGQNPGSTNSLDLLVAFPQCENVTGQSNQNPSEYVSVGVLSSTYHGYFVDGVKYFSYQNGNTVASNIVTEAQGAAISGTIGYLAEGARTNRCLHSQAFSNAVWVSGGGGIAVTDNSIAAPDGTTTADTLTASGANGTLIQDLGVVASAAKAGGLWLKRKTGTGNIDITLDGGATWTTKAVTSTWTRFEISQTLADEDFGIRIVTSGDEVYAWQGQVETAAFLSSDIPTTTAAVARNADVLTCPFAGIGNDVQGAVYIEAITSSTTGNGTSSIPLAFSSNSSLLYLNSGDARTVINSYDGTTVVTKTGLTDISTALRKRACSWGNGGMSITGDGAAPATSVFDGALGSTSITIGAATGGTSQWFGVIKAVRIYRSRLRDAQLQAMTS